MKRIYTQIQHVFCWVILTFAFGSCGDFLDRPTVDSYTIDIFYQTDEQCFQAVNPIYNPRW